MPTIAQEGGFRFIIHPREYPFEPPHVHVKFAEHEVRIELPGGTFMDEPPAGKRSAILQAYAKHAQTIYEAWVHIHGGDSSWRRRPRRH